MTTWHDVGDLEKKNERMATEIADARNLFKQLLEVHKRTNGGRDCSCQLCFEAKTWISRNK